MLWFFCLVGKVESSIRSSISISFAFRRLALGNAARWISFITMSISNLVMPFFLQLAMGLDPLRAGFLVAPTPLAMALLAPLTGWMSERFAPERLCALGLAVNGGVVFLGFLPAGASAVEIILALALLGVGMGIFQTPNNNLLMSSVPRHRLGRRLFGVVDRAQFGIFRRRGVGRSDCQRSARGCRPDRLRCNFSAARQRKFIPAVSRRSCADFVLRCSWRAVLCFIGAAISAVRVSREQV